MKKALIIYTGELPELLIGGTIEAKRNGDPVEVTIEIAVELVRRGDFKAAPANEKEIAGLIKEQEEKEKAAVPPAKPSPKKRGAASAAPANEEAQATE